MNEYSLSPMFAIKNGKNNIKRYDSDAMIRLIPNLVEPNIPNTIAVCSISKM